MTHEEFFDGLSEAFAALRTGEHWGGPHSHEIEEMIATASPERKTAAFMCLYTKRIPSGTLDEINMAYEMQVINDNTP